MGYTIILLFSIQTEIGQSSTPFILFNKIHFIPLVHLTQLFFSIFLKYCNVRAFILDYWYKTNIQQQKGDVMNKRKRQIILAARKLFIKKGFTDTSIMDIISEANVSKGTFYNHFSSKNACLIAILEETREETINERYKIGINKDPSDVNVLVNQISQLLHISRKRNLMEIFSSIFGNADKEIIDVLEKHFMLEVEWLAKRLVEIYGEKIKDISYECATQVFGMIQFTIRILMISNKQQWISPESVVKVVLGHNDAIIHRLLETKEIVITPNIFNSYQDDIDEKVISKVTIIEQLQLFNEKLTEKDSENSVELANFLLEELQRPDERLHVLESIFYFFSKSFENTPHREEVNEISISFWEYLERKKSNH